MFSLAGIVYNYIIHFQFALFNKMFVTSTKFLVKIAFIRASKRLGIG